MYTVDFFQQRVHLAGSTSETTTTTRQIWNGITRLLVKYVDAMAVLIWPASPTRRNGISSATSQSMDLHKISTHIFFLLEYLSWLCFETGTDIEMMWIKLNSTWNWTITITTKTVKKRKLKYDSRNWNTIATLQKLYTQGRNHIQCRQYGLQCRGPVDHSGPKCVPV